MEGSLQTAMKAVGQAIQLDGAGNGRVGDRISPRGSKRVGKSFPAMVVLVKMCCR